MGGRITKRPSNGARGGRAAGRRLPNAFTRALRGYDGQGAGGGGDGRSVIDVINPRGRSASASSGDDDDNDGGGDAAEPRNRLQRLLDKFRRIRLR